MYKEDCPLAKKFTDNKRKVSVWWDGGVSNDPIPVRLEVKGVDRQGIYLEIVECISSTKTNMLEAGATLAPGNSLIARFLIEIEHLDQLKEILENLRNIKDVIHAERINS